MKEGKKAIKSYVVVAETLPFYETTWEKIEKFDVSELEDILFSILKSEFKMIEYVGGVLGFFIGITQILIFRFT